MVHWLIGSVNLQLVKSCLTQPNVNNFNISYEKLLSSFMLLSLSILTTLTVPRSPHHTVRMMFMTMSKYGEPNVKTICPESTQKCFTFFIYFTKVQLNLVLHLRIIFDNFADIFSYLFELNILYFKSTVSMLHVSICCNIILHIWFNENVPIQLRGSILKLKAPFPAGIPNWRPTGEDLQKTYKSNNILFKAYQYCYAWSCQISWLSVYIKYPDEVCTFGQVI